MGARVQKEADPQMSPLLGAASILDPLPIGVTIQDRTGKLVYANAEGAALLGFPSGPAVASTPPADILARFEVFTEDGATVPVDALPGRRALRGEDPGELLLRVRDITTGAASWRVATATAIRDERGEVAFAVNLFRDITDEKLAELRLNAQFEVTRALAESQSLEEATPRVMEAICRGLQWDLGLMWRMDEVANVLRLVEGWRSPGVDLELFERRSKETALTMGVGLPGRVWTAREPAWITDVQEDPNFPRGAEAGVVGLHGAFGFPVMAGDELLGVMEFFSREVRAPDTEVLRLTSTLGIQIGGFIERRKVDEHQRFLVEVGDALAQSLDYERTLRQIARLAVPRMVDTCLIYMVDEETREISRVVIEDRAFGPELASRLAEEFRLDPEAPVGVPRVIRSGEPELHPEATAELMAAPVDDPEGLRRMLEPAGIRSWICVPIAARGRTLGAMAFVTSVSQRRLDQDELALAQELAWRAAVAVDNARLYQVAEEAQHRLAFLAEASRLLSRSLDYGRTLRRIAQLAVPQLADWCAVDILEEDGSLHQVAVAHTDPDKVELARELRRRYPSDPEAPTGIWQVLRTGEPMMVPEISDELLEQGARDPEHLELLRTLEMRSGLIVPLVARGRTLGAISLVAAESGRVYGERDLTLATDLARRAAVAVDNARLYRERAHVARTLQKSLLPPELPRIEGLELAARYRPAGTGADIGGDFYDVIQIAEGEWAVLIGDVCGKGVEAAALTGLARQSIRTTLRHGGTAEEAFEALNEEIRHNSDTPNFCTVAYSHLARGPDGVRATVVCAGHPQPLVLRTDGRMEHAGKPGTLIGVTPDLYFEPHNVDLSPGDALFLYTDGLVEGLAGDEGAEAVLSGFLAGCAGGDAETIADTVDRAMGSRATAARDDSAFVVVRAVGSPG